MTSASDASPRRSAPRFTVAVTGATGFVGRHVVRELLARSHRARALIRDPSRSRETLPASPALSFVRGDGTDPRALADLCAGADAVIHLIGIRREFPRAGVTYRRLHVEATAAILHAAQAAGARRFVHISALGARADAPSLYHRTKHQAEEHVRRSGLAWTIFRPSIIHGPGGEFMQLARGWVTGHAPPYTFLPFFFREDPQTGEAIPGRAQPVAVEDLAAAIVDAIPNRRAVGEIYPIGGPDALDWPDLLALVQRAVPGANAKLKPRGLSGAFASRAARAAKRLGVDRALPFGPDEPLMAMEDNTCSLAKAREHLSFSPRPFEESVAAYAHLL